MVANADPEGLLHLVFDYDQNDCGVLNVFAEDGDVDEEGKRTYGGQLLLKCDACSGTKRKGKWKYKPIPPFGPILIPGTGRCGIGIHGGCGKYAFPCVELADAFGQTMTASPAWDACWTGTVDITTTSQLLAIGKTQRSMLQ